MTQSDLAKSWRDKANRIRSEAAQSANSLAMAITFEACASELEQVLGELKNPLLGTTQDENDPHETYYKLNERNSKC